MGVYIIVNKNSGKKENASNEEGNSLVDKYEVELNNNGVDEVVLNNLFDVLGIPSLNRQYGDSALNYLVSNSNYSNDAKDIISYYGNTWDEKTLFRNPPDEVYSSEECGVGAAGCKIISKNEAQRIYNLYNFTGKITDYFKETSLLENDYIFFVTNTSPLTMWNGADAGIKHNVTSEHINNSDVKIIDNQIVSYYDENSTSGDIIKQNRTVIYIFKNNNSEYYLSSVEVK